MTSPKRYIPIVGRYWDEDGNPLANATFYTYHSGTNIAAPTYQVGAEAIVNDWPLKLDAQGRVSTFFAEDYLPYRVNLVDQYGAQVPTWPKDNLDSWSYTGNLV